MCGIFGVVLHEPRTIELDAALRTIGHRGPDATGRWTSPEAILGHTRLAILDLTPAGAQPMASADQSVLVVFNGEIYNHHALRSELIGLGHHFRSRCDTEVIVEGYRAWGDRVIDRLDGMFAIGVWDVSKRRLLLARDRMGEKPLFFSRERGCFRFASEVKAIIASGFPAEVESAALPVMLAYGYTPAPRTMFRGVEQLPPASTLTLEWGGQPSVHRYWKAPFAAPPMACSTDQAVSDIRRLVEAAVHRRLEADVPLGAFLSGGIDSTVIVGVMTRLLGKRVKTFSIGFAGDAAYDETHFARLASRAFDTDHVEFTLEPSSFDLVEKLVDLHDGPFGDSSAIPTSVVAGLTREHVTVALTGDGGDELFCGYVRFLAAEAAEQMPAAVRQAGALFARRLPRNQGERGLLSRARRFLDASSLPLADRLSRLSSLFAFDLDILIREDVRASMSIAEPLEWTKETLAYSHGATTLARILDHNFETYLPYDLLVKADRSSMFHGLETRTPFLDKELVEYAARLPDGLKRRGLTTKWILKRAFADILPKEIFSRGKMGFGVPLGSWFRTGLKTYLLDHLTATGELYTYVQRAYVSRLVDEHLSGRADHGHRLWLLLTLEVWLRSLRRQPLACAA